MPYSILLAPPAERQLKAFAPAIQKRLVKRLTSLRGNPRPLGVKKLAGEDNLYRVREGDYRIIYTIRPRQEIDYPRRQDRRSQRCVSPLVIDDDG